MTKRGNPTADIPKLTFEWSCDDEQVALSFTLDTWLAFESTARAKGTTAQEMITRAVVHTLGDVVFDRANSETGNA